MSLYEIKSPIGLLSGGQFNGNGIFAAVSLKIYIYIQESEWFLFDLCKYRPLRFAYTHCKEERVFQGGTL